MQDFFHFLTGMNCYMVMHFLFTGRITETHKKACKHNKIMEIKDKQNNDCAPEHDGLLNDQS